MESKAKRTLVKSAPELWELADDLARMEAWMAGLVGTAEPVPVEVTDREPGADPRLALRRSRGRRRGSRSSSPRRASAPRSRSPPSTAARPSDADAALEQLLDELGSPERRPFERG